MDFAQWIFKILFVKNESFSNLLNLFHEMSGNLVRQIIDVM